MKALPVRESIATARSVDPDRLIVAPIARGDFPSGGYRHNAPETRNAAELQVDQEERPGRCPSVCRALGREAIRRAELAMPRQWSGVREE